MAARERHLDYCNPFDTLTALHIGVNGYLDLICESGTSRLCWSEGLYGRSHLRYS